MSYSPSKWCIVIITAVSAESEEYQMKIKLAICCSDQTYSKRLSMRFLNKYSEHVEVYQYSDVNIALGDLSPQKIDVFICDSDIDVDFSSIPRKCGFAFLTDSTEIETVRGKRTI